jgi:hypothetical protein
MSDTLRQEPLFALEIAEQKTEEDHLRLWFIAV